MPNLYADQIQLNMQIGENVSLAGVSGLLTNTTVAAAHTNAGLQAAVTAAAASNLLHSDVGPIAPRVNRAIAAGLVDGTLSDANINTCSTIQAVVNLTYATGTTLTSLFIE